MSNSTPAIEVARIKAAKAAIKASVNNKLGSSSSSAWITDETIDDYSTFIDRISTGGGSDNVVAGYFINTDGVITFQPVSGGSAETVTDVKIVDTNVDEPAYSGEDDMTTAKLVMRRPVSDSALYPKVIGSSSTDFTNTITINAATTSSVRTYFKVFDGSEYIDLPSSGLGTAFDAMPVIMNLTPFSSLTKPIYIKYCWTTADATPVESDYEATVYPSIHTFSPKDDA